MNSSLRTALGPLVLACSLVGPALGQAAVPGQRGGAGRLSPALRFLAPYGLENFSQHHVRALDTFLLAERWYQGGDYPAAKRVLDALWAEYPTGTPGWSQLPYQPFGLNLGTPPAYYGLRMLSDMTDWRLASGVTTNLAPRTARLTVLLVGHTAGIEPRTVQELQAGTGVAVVHDLDLVVPADGHRVVHQSLRLFRDYVFAMTEGRLALETSVLELPDVTLAVSASVLPGGGYYAGLQNAGEVWASVPAQVQDETDWWWILYPSHVPEQYPAFTTAEFITGGMGVGPDGGSPYFIIDDRWLVRKPPHLGSGPYSDVERRVYLPQWLQHEFFHHLYRTYPEYGLEASSHQWFDLGTWPPDFVGLYEPDYYHESLYRRLVDADPPLHVALRYATADAPWDQLVLGDVLGTYQRLPIENAWHVGTVHVTGGGQLRWTNTAGVTWNLTPDLPGGELATGPDCPYYTPPTGPPFHIALERDALGDWTTEVEGFRFLGELYRKQ